MTLLEYINSEPRGFFLPDMATNGLELVDLTPYEVYLNPENQLKLARTMNEFFESDFIYGFCDGGLFCEILGCEMYKPDDDFPSVMSHPVKTIEDVRALNVPNPYEDIRMKTNLETIELISKNIDKPYYTSIQGPFTLAVQLAGATHFLRSIIKEPQFVKELLDFTVQVIETYAVAAWKAGTKYLSIAEPAAVTLDLHRFDKLVVPSVNRIFDQISCWKGMHICGDTTELLPSMIKCHLDAISLDQMMDYNKVMKIIPENIVLIGNLDPIELVGKGSPSKIIEETRRMKSDMRAYNNYLCALG
ncbi:MAG: uroporphyrinogen decarboxylase family protein [Filifactoraceae bacterium]